MSHEDPDWRVRQAVITVLPDVLESNVRATLNVKVSELVAKKAGWEAGGQSQKPQSSSGASRAARSWKMSVWTCGRAR